MKICSIPFVLKVNEELARGSIVHKFVASDPDSNIDKFRIMPKSDHFSIEPDTGNLKVSSRIDYEALDIKRLTFDLVVFDAGVPQKSASAFVVANIVNLNDETPLFKQVTVYFPSTQLCFMTKYVPRHTYFYIF